jgi:uncharacterized protein YraI
MRLDVSATTKCRRIPCYMNVYVMRRFWFKTYLGGVVVAGLVAGVFFTVRQVRAYQDPSIYITVTYSEPINVRGGPSTIHYPIVGRLSPGDTAVALGTSPGREWVQIAYPGAPGGVGWVYAIYVSVTGGELLVVEAPSTPTPEVTSTIDPTLAAAFNFQPTVTRLPTFTPPPPLTVPHFTEVSTPRSSMVAPGIFVVSLILLGTIGFIASIIFRK